MLQIQDLTEDVAIEPNDSQKIGTGIAIHLPSGYEAQVRPRSGVTSKTNLRVRLGTIDNSYTGEVFIIVDNIPLKDKYANSKQFMKFLNGGTSKEDNIYFLDNPTYKIKKGDKLAQLVIAPIPMIESYEIDELPTTTRGNKGFGSSGY